jgi:hypothetical protein
MSNRYYKYVPSPYKSNKKYPNNDKSQEGNKSPMDFDAQNFDSLLFNYKNEQNGVKLGIEKNEDKLKKRLKEKEVSIKIYCKYYISLENIFDEADDKIKNKLVAYVTEFNSACQNFSNIAANNYFERKERSEDKKKLKEDLNKKNKDYNELEEKNRKERGELKERYANQIMELNFKIKDLENKNKKLQDENEKLNNIIAKNEKEKIYLNEKIHNNRQPSSPDRMVVIPYYLGDKTDTMEINIDCPGIKDFQEFSEKFKTAENNFNTFEKLLVETNNKAYEKFKQLYFKIKGKEWIETNNSFIRKLYSTDIFNIDQNIAWTNIFHIQGTIENIINEIFNLVDPTENCDPKKLNEDSCEFLLNYIIGLKKLFFLQKEILDNSFDFIEDYETKNKKLKNFRKITKDAENFFDKNDKILFLVESTKLKISFMIFSIVS